MTLWKYLPRYQTIASYTGYNTLYRISAYIQYSPYRIQYSIQDTILMKIHYTYLLQAKNNIFNYFILCIQYCQSRQELSENVFHGISQGSLGRFKLGQLCHIASLLLENTYMGNGANKGYLCLLYLNALVGNVVMGKAVPR